MTRHLLANAELEPWEYGALGITDPAAPGPLAAYFEHIRAHHDRISGDIVEFGVYRGASLLATALLLRSLGSDKTVYGFDTFSGFPTTNPKDDPNRFEQLHVAGIVTDDHLERVRRNREHRSAVLGREAAARDISTSADFSATSVDYIERRAQHLGLTNIRLVPGNFDETLCDEGNHLPERIAAALIDCDLYDGYRTALPWVFGRLSAGGMMYLDEYYSLKVPGARIATDEFCDSVGARPRLLSVDTGGFERWAIIGEHSDEG